MRKIAESGEKREQFRRAGAEAVQGAGIDLDKECRAITSQRRDRTFEHAHFRALHIDLDQRHGPARGSTQIIDRQGWNRNTGAADLVVAGMVRVDLEHGFASHAIGDRAVHDNSLGEAPARKTAKQFGMIPCFGFDRHHPPLGTGPVGKAQGKEADIGTHIDDDTAGWYPALQAIDFTRLQPRLVEIVEGKEHPATPGIAKQAAGKYQAVERQQPALQQPAHSGLLQHHQQAERHQAAKQGQQRLLYPQQGLHP